MGNIGSQTIKGSIYSYLGVVIGFLSITFLRSYALSIEQVGVLEVIMSYAMILAQLGSLGFLNGSVRCFPFFRNPDNQHNGYFFLLLVIPAFGTLFFILLYFLLKSILPHNNYFDFIAEHQLEIAVFAITTLLFNILDTYYRTAYYNAATGSILRDFLQKLTVAAAMGLMLFISMPFKWFLILWLTANGIPTLIIFFLLKQEGKINIKPHLNFITPEFRRMLSSASLFAVITGFTSMIIQYIDRIMLDGMTSAELTGIYGTAALFGVVVSLPSRTMYRIGSVVMAEKWKDNDLQGIQSVYKKSCVNQLFIGLLLFIGIWANIDNIFKLLPEGYESGKYVILFVSLGGLIEMATGLNGVILATSKYYRSDTYFFLVLIILTIGANFYFIPLWGINGAAIASALATLVFNVFRLCFVWYKFGLKPFDLRSFYLLLIGFTVLATTQLAIPTLKWFLLDIFLRSGVITFAYVGLIYYLKVVPEVRQIIDKNLNKILR